MADQKLTDRTQTTTSDNDNIIHIVKGTQSFSIDKGDFIGDRMDIAEGKITNLEGNQYSGVEVYDELTDLPGTGTALVSYKVANDPTSSNNGYYHWNGASYTKDADLTTGKIEAGDVDAISGDTAFDGLRFKSNLEKGKNRFNKHAITSGSITNAGNFFASGTNSHTELMPCTPGEVYICSHEIKYTCYYDEDKVFVAGGLNPVLAGVTYTIPAGVYFQIITIYNVSIDSIQLELGDTQTNLHLYNEKVPTKNVRAYELLDIEISLIADTHITNSVSNSSMNKLAEDSISLLNKIPADFGVHLGDLINFAGSQAQTDEAVRIFERLKIPMYFVAGNHDVNPDTQAELTQFYDTVPDAYYRNAFSYGDNSSRLGYYHVNVRGINLIVLNQNFYNDATANWKINDTQLTWLQTTLDSITGSDSKIIVCSHLSLTENLNETAYYRHDYTQAGTIRGKLETWETSNGKVLGCFSGHEHKNTLNLINGINYVCFDAQSQSAYTGDYAQLCFAHLKWVEAEQKLLINGIGTQTSYEFDYS